LSVYFREPDRTELHCSVRFKVYWYRFLNSPSYLQTRNWMHEEHSIRMPALCLCVWVW
jgi:hypothetical protein